MVSSLSLPERQLLELIAAALGDRDPEVELFVGQVACDWQVVARLAGEQSVLGLMVRSMLRLPRELQAERSLRIQLALHKEAIERHSRKHHERLQPLYQRYEEEGFYPVLLKGVTMAQLYPEPELRSLGDVDFFLPHEGSYERANAWAVAEGCTLIGQSVYEQAYKREGLVVENHRLLTYFGIPRYDKALERITGELTAQDAWAYTTIEGQRYRTLPLELNAVYVFHHILHHFSYLGIGLRQICDWFLLMTSCHERLDIDCFSYYAEQFDLLRPMQLFALMGVRYLGIAPEVFPFVLPEDKRSVELAELIIRDTFVGGNFGFEHFAGKRFRSIWSRRWFMFKRTTLRSFRVAEVSPEHIRLIPLIAIITRLKLLFRSS